MYVGNLSFDASFEDIKSLFEAHGGVEDVFIVKDRESGRPRGFAFVTMETEALNGEEFLGRPLVINEARPREERSGGGRNFGGDRRGGGGGRNFGEDRRGGGRGRGDRRGGGGREYGGGEY